LQQYSHVTFNPIASPILKLCYIHIYILHETFFFYNETTKFLLLCSFSNMWVVCKQTNKQTNKNIQANKLCSSWVYIYNT